MFLITVLKRNENSIPNCSTPFKRQFYICWVLFKQGQNKIRYLIPVTESREVTRTGSVAEVSPFLVLSSWFSKSSIPSSSLSSSDESYFALVNKQKQ